MTTGPRKKLPGNHGQTNPYCRPGQARAKHLSHSRTDIFRIGTAFAPINSEPRLGRALAVRTIRGRRAWEGFGFAAHRRGEPAMGNTLPVGLSRQMGLEPPL